MDDQNRALPCQPERINDVRCQRRTGLPRMIAARNILGEKTKNPYLAGFCA